MSEENETEDELLTVTKPIIAVFFTITGILLGGAIGLFGTYYFCVFIGNGLEQVGWLYLFLTIPIGMLAGGGLGCFLPLYILRNKK
ncbi:hypothetical protein [Gimesia aquarii]|uniref:Uncharacterized protein n=1 Tax=Gimesia aquarii TaxID=2527964 RepID=A0A517VP61_9PLAN|nr:hypothetical protein [Gimesia aquarii]QDT94811.1 hypothetical protein V144x_02430 [Gimesia aquarii]